MRLTRKPRRGMSPFLTLLCGLCVCLGACNQELPTSTAASFSYQDFSDTDPIPAAPQSVAAEAPPPGVSSGTPQARSFPEADPFLDTTWTDIPTKTRFAPQLHYNFDPPQQGLSPETTIEMYQTKGELEVKEVRFLVEGARFRFDRLAKEMIVGDGRLDVGTPPKLSIPAQVSITDTDQKTYAVAKVEANSLFASVYVADIRIKQQAQALSIVSVSNFARGNNRHAQHTTEASARVVQRLYPGYLILPSQETMRVRALTYSEPDPAGDRAEGLRVHQQALLLVPAASMGPGSR